MSRFMGWTALFVTGLFVSTSVAHSQLAVWEQTNITSLQGTGLQFNFDSSITGLDPNEEEVDVAWIGYSLKTLPDGTRSAESHHAVTTSVGFQDSTILPFSNIPEPSVWVAVELHGGDVGAAWFGFDEYLPPALKSGYDYWNHCPPSDPACVGGSTHFFLPLVAGKPDLALETIEVDVMVVRPPATLLYSSVIDGEIEDSNVAEVDNVTFEINEMNRSAALPQGASQPGLFEAGDVVVAIEKPSMRLFVGRVE